MSNCSLVLLFYSVGANCLHAEVYKHSKPMIHKFYCNFLEFSKHAAQVQAQDIFLVYQTSVFDCVHWLCNDPNALHWEIASHNWDQDDDCCLKFWDGWVCPNGHCHFHLYIKYLCLENAWSYTANRHHAVHVPKTCFQAIDETQCWQHSIKIEMTMHALIQINHMIRCGQQGIYFIGVKQLIFDELQSFTVVNVNFTHTGVWQRHTRRWGHASQLRK